MTNQTIGNRILILSTNRSHSAPSIPVIIAFPVI